jgi:myosin heavy subunit
MKEHVWVRKSAVYKALGKKQGEQTDSSFDWARAILLSVGVNNSPIISLELDDDDLPDDIQGQHVKLPQNSLILPTNQWVDSSQQEPPSDLITLTHLHEAAVVYCLEKRFQQNQIYTATGPILIALNPFQDLPDLYSEATMSKYWAAGEGIHFMENLPPHVYESAHDAFKRMMESLMQQKEMELHYQNDESLPNVVCNQVILVSGESGAGKTVTTKHLMRYLATLSQRKAEHLKKRRAPSPGRSETNLPERTKLVRRISARSVSWKAGALIEEKSTFCVL